jgi:hypothetical protein
MRCICGAFLKLPPVKKVLMSDMLRSAFLNSMKKATEMAGKGWATRL